MGSVAGKVAPRFLDAYSASTTYQFYDMVTHNNAMWICKKSGTVGVTPSKANSAYWFLAVDGAFANTSTLGGYTAKEVGQSGARNLVPYPHYETTNTESGITFTDNGDGTVHAKGTSTAQVSFIVRATAENWTLRSGTYALSGCPEGGSFSTYRLQLARFVDGTLTSYANEYGSGAVAEITDGLPLLMQIVIASGVAIDATFKPMLEPGKVAHEYVPYNFGNAETLHGLSVSEVGQSGARNLLPYPYYETTGAEAGITWTDNGNGTITANGTSTAQAYFTFTPQSANLLKQLQDGEIYTFSDGSESSDCYTFIAMFDSSGTEISRFRTTKGPVSFIVNKNTIAGITITGYVPSGVTLNNVTLKPMLEIGSVTHDYVPYYSGGAVDAKTVGGLTVYTSLDQIFPDGLVTYHIPTIVNAMSAGSMFVDEVVYQKEYTTEPQNFFPTGYQNGLLEILKPVASSGVKRTRVLFSAGTNADKSKFFVCNLDETNNVVLGWNCISDGGNADTLDGYDSSQFFKAKRILTSDDDVDDITLESGQYYWTSANVPKNAPYNNAAFLDVMKFNDNRVEQVCTRAGVSGFSKERVYADGWKNWSTKVLENGPAIASSITLDNGTEYAGFQSIRTQSDGTTRRAAMFHMGTGANARMTLKNMDTATEEASLNLSPSSLYVTFAGSGTKNILHTGNSIPVVPGTTAPTDTTALWVVPKSS